MLSVQKKREARTAWGMMAPVLLMLSLFIVVPFLVAFWLSLTNERLIPRPIPTRFVGIENYWKILNDLVFWQALRNTSLFAVLIVPIQSAFGLGLAMLINKPLRKIQFYRSLFFLPTIIAMVVVCVVWAGMLNYPNGVINHLLSSLSANVLGPYDYLKDTHLAMPTLIGMSIWQGVGFQMIIYLAGLQMIPSDLYEAAYLDGAGKFQQFRYITVPSLKNTHIVVMITTTILAFKVFTQMAVLTKGGPLGTTKSLVYYIYESGFQRQKIGYSSAVAVLFFFIVLSISIVQRRLIAEDRELS